jgi:hypothetical protein
MYLCFCMYAAHFYTLQDVCCFTLITITCVRCGSKNESCKYAMAHRVCVSWRANMKYRMRIRYTPRRTHVHVDACVCKSAIRDWHVCLTVIMFEWLYYSSTVMVNIRCVCVYIIYTYAVLYHENVPYLFNIVHIHVDIYARCVLVECGL